MDTIKTAFLATIGVVAALVVAGIMLAFGLTFLLMLVLGT